MRVPDKTHLGSLVFHLANLLWNAEYGPTLNYELVSAEVLAFGEHTHRSFQIE
jgi:hypothetical protein